MSLEQTWQNVLKCSATAIHRQRAQIIQMKERQKNATPAEYLQLLAQIEQAQGTLSTWIRVNRRAHRNLGRLVG